MSELTQLLSVVEQSDSAAAERLLPLVYDELRHLAARKLSHEKPGQTLQATALVHEAWLRLVDRETGASESKWNSRRHFFGAAAEAMRRILIANARRKQRLKHGGGWERVPLDAIELPSPMPDDSLLALDEALTRLTEFHAKAAEVVKLCFFVGLSHEQTAEALGISLATVDRLWAFARAWLHAETKTSGGGG